MNKKEDPPEIHFLLSLKLKTFRPPGCAVALQSLSVMETVLTSSEEEEEEEEEEEVVVVVVVKA